MTYSPYRDRWCSPSYRVQYEHKDIQDQYGQYDKYGQYGPYGQNGEYDQYGYGLEQEDMEQGYQIGGNVKNKYKMKMGRSKRQSNQSSHVCPVHGLYEQGKYGKNYEETRKEIMRFEGMEGGESKFGSEKNIEGRGKGRGRRRGRREENKYEYIEKQINKIQGENKIDNYKFYESKNLSKKTSSVSVQNIINSSESNVNSLKIKNMAGRGNMSLVGVETGMGVGQSQGIQTTQSSEYSKVYIATKVTPVYSEHSNQQQLLNISGTGNHTCNLCGANFSSLGQMTSNSQGIINICPLHGYNLLKKKI